MAANLTPERRPDSDLESNVKPRKSSVSINVIAGLIISAFKNYVRIISFSVVKILITYLSKDD
jgi:hypothetical protein